MNRYLIIAVVVLAVLFSGAVKYGIDIKKDRDRVQDNFEQAGRENSEMNLKYGEEFKNLLAIKNKYAITLDSVMKVNKIKPKEVIKATIVNIAYKDTTSHEAIHSAPYLMPDSTVYKIEVSYKDSCWAMKGEIITTDPKAKLILTDRESKTSIQLLEQRKRVFGFLWWKKGKITKAYNDCGEVDFSIINFK